MDCDEILWRVGIEGPGWYNEELIKFFGYLGF